MSELKLYSPFRAHDIFSVNRIAKATGINKDRLYLWLKKEKCRDLTLLEKGKIKAIIDEARKDLFKSIDER